jgi:D-alanine--D-alanine ligase
MEISGYNDLFTARIGVITGGKLHRERVLQTAQRVLEALGRRRYHAEILDTESPAFLDQVSHIDVAYIAPFGRHGDDGSLQGFLATLGIPYTGSGVTACAISVDKVLSKKILSLNGINTPDSFEVDYGGDLRWQADEIARILGLPLILKPVLEGGSRGICLAESVSQLGGNIERLRHFGRVFAEQHVEGRTLTVGIVGYGMSLQVLPVHEVEFAGGKSFLDPVSLFKPGMAWTVIPPRITAERASEVEQLALRAHEAIGAYGLSRVDFRLSHEDRAYALEVNTLPAITEMSDLPIAARRVGIDFDGLVENILKTAVNRPSHLR